jgi:GAF domain-containing protein
MLVPELPSNESERLESLAAHNLLDTLPEGVYDDITRLAAEICGTPIAAINLIDADRLWSKSTTGIPRLDLPRNETFCAHTILGTEPIVVEDARYDERFFDSPSTVGNPALLFYAGVPVQDTEGRALGSLCVMDTRPRQLTEFKVESLKALAKLVNTHFQLRRTNIELQNKQQQLEAARPIIERLGKAAHLVGDNGSEPNNHLRQLEQDIALLQQVLREKR